MKDVAEYKVKEEVWQIIQELNRAWVMESDTVKLENYFHKNMAAITATERYCLLGRDACIASWDKFIKTTKIHYYKEIDPEVQLYNNDNAAVVTYYYDMAFDKDGKTIKTAGRDMFFLVKEEGRWWIVADRFSLYPPESNSFIIRPLQVIDQPFVIDLLKEHWGGHRIISRGKIHYADKLHGFIVLQDNKPVGLITYNIENENCEIVTLNSLADGIGIGTDLIEAVNKTANSAGCKRLCLITTNDNLKALHFYQKRGFSLVAVHRNAILESRKLKSEIPLIGMDGIPLRDEIELEMIL